MVWAGASGGVGLQGLILRTSMGKGTRPSGLTHSLHPQHVCSYTSWAAAPVLGPLSHCNPHGRPSIVCGCGSAVGRYPPLESHVVICKGACDMKTTEQQNEMSCVFMFGIMPVKLDACYCRNTYRVHSNPLCQPASHGCITCNSPRPLCCTPRATGATAKDRCCTTPRTAAARPLTSSVVQGVGHGHWHTLAEAAEVAAACMMREEHTPQNSRRDSN